MKFVYWLMHVKESSGVDDVKTIGIFESRELATKAQEIASVQEGFRDNKDGFHIDKYELNKMYWDKGFSTT